MVFFRLLWMTATGLVTAGLVTSGSARNVAAATVLPVQVTPADGTPYAANLVGISENGIQLEIAGTSKTVALEDVRRIQRSQAADVTPPTMSAGLRGGSRLRSEGLRIKDEVATLLMRRQDAMQIPLSQLDWVRFRSENAAIDPDWLGIVGQQQVDDILVIRRSATAIDQAPGIVLGADESKVEFDLGGSAVPAPIAKLEGVVFANRSPQEPTGTIVTDIMGSQWSVESLAAGSSADNVTLVLSSDVRRELRLDQIDSIRFTDGSTLLATLEPVSSDYQPLIKLSIDPDLLKQWLGGRSDNNRDLILRSRSTVVYRVDADAAKFVSLVAPDRRVEAGSGAIVRVRLGDQVAWEQSIAPGDDAKGVELDVSDSSRITLEVDYGDGPNRGDAGDVIRFIEPRFLK
jgi:hypothetical protein